uniref:peptidylprolyl isomerase n=1 Tax=Stappia sp. TaxID=1870903 RepID=UPI003BA95598
MLNTLREGAKSWISKLLLILLVLSFAVWGISGSMLNIGSDKVATVGDEGVSVVEFDRAYRQELDRIGRQIGRPLSTVEGAAFGLPGQVLGQLLAEAALNQTATDLNLGVSDEEMVRLIQTATAFQAPGGGFDRALLARVLQANGFTEDEFVAERRRFEERRQIAEALGGGIKTPAPMLEAFNQHANETRTVNFVVLDAAAAGEIPAPDAETLSAYFEDNKARFRAPEYRKAVLLELTPEKIAKPDEVSEEEVRQAYEADTSRFGEPERRRILQLSLTGEEAQDTARAALEAGKNFDDILAELQINAEDIDLGLMTRGDLVDPAIAEAAFALGEGEASGLVEGRFAPVLLKVTEVSPAHKTPLAEVADTLRQEIAVEKASREILDLHDEIEDARAGGATLAEVSERFNLTLDTPPAFDAQGNAMDGGKVTLPEVDGLVSDVFDSDVGIETDVLQMGRTGFLWFEVSEVVPARDRSLDEVRDQVVAAWTEAERGKRLDAAAGEMVSALNDGGELAALAAERGTEVRTAEGVKRSTSGGPLPADAVSGVFSGPVGTVGRATASDGSRVVYRVADVQVPAFFREQGEIATLDTRLAEALQASIIGQYVQERETALGVSVNQANLNRVIGAGQGG